MMKFEKKKKGNVKERKTLVCMSDYNKMRNFFQVKILNPKKFTNFFNQPYKRVESLLHSECCKNDTNKNPKP
jgi:hypothetical protein